MKLRCCKLRNLGDSANVDLVKAITGKAPICVNNSYKLPKNEIIYMVMGSVIGWANSQTIIWGAGKMSNTNSTMPKEGPKQILAVRGPHTRKELIRGGYSCPEVYGDPFLLMSKFYPQELTKEYELGIIPHQIDKKLIPQLKQQFPKALIIDIQRPVLQVIANICKCKAIASSALHGIICADTYEIPSIWLKMSEKVLGKGFKYRDYFESIQRRDNTPLLYDKNTTYDAILKKLEGHTIAKIDLNPLWNCCPFEEKK